MTGFWKRALALLLSVLLLCGTGAVTAAAFDPAADDGVALTITPKFYREDADGNWVETARAKPGEALKLRFFIGTDFYTNAFNFGFAYDQKFFSNALAAGPTLADATLGANPPAGMFDYSVGHADESANAVVRGLVNAGLITQADLDAMDYMTGSSTWNFFGTNQMISGSDWLFELDLLSVADNDYVRTAGQTGVVEAPATLGTDNATGVVGLFEFQKGEAGQRSTANYAPGNGWAPAVTSVPAEISVFSSYVLQGNGGSFDGAASATVSGVIGESAAQVFASVPVRDGFEFAGYARTPDGVALSAAEIEALTFDYDDATLYALWTAASETYYYTFDAGDGAFADGSKVKVCVFGAEDAPAAPEEPTLPGYAFTGWDAALTPLATKTLTACYEALPWAVTFVSADGETLAASEVLAGEQVTAGDLPEGYRPIGWTDQDGNAVTFPLTVTGALTLKADESSNRYTARFYVDDALYAETVAAYEEEIVLPADPEKIGSTFLMWAPDAEGVLQDTEELSFDAVFEPVEYTLTLALEGGTSADALVQTYYYGDPIPQPAAPEKTGFTFAGWSPAVPETMPAEHLTVTATWTANQYTLTLDANGGSFADGTQVQAITEVYGAPVPAETPTRTGYTFTGWEPALPATMPAESGTLTAQWAAIPYTMEYFFSGDVPAVAEPDPVTVHYGDAIPLPALPEEPGYTCGGWVVYDENDQAVPANATVTGNLYAMAEWSMVEYTVTYVFDGEVPAGVTAPEAITDALIGDAIPLPAVAAVEGFTFEGWTLSGDAEGKVGAQNVTVTGTWSRNRHTATFKTDYFNISAETVAYGDAISFPTAPKMTGNTHVGWKTPGGEVVTAATMGDADVTFTAVYEKNHYTAAFVADEITVGAYDVVFGDAIPQPAAPEKTGYAFEGWTPAVPATMPAADQTFTAVFTAVDYTVTFVVDGVETQATYHYGDAIVRPEDPAKEGNTFAGWSPELPPTMPAESLTVTATWAPEGYTLTLNANGGQFSNGAAVRTAVLNYGDALTMIEVPTRAGYRFNGWDRGVPRTMPADDLTLTAEWTAVDYRIEYFYSGDVPAGVTDPAAVKAHIGDLIPLPEHPAVAGYAVTAWEAFDHSDAPYAGSRVGTSDLYLMAEWSMVEYTVTYGYVGNVPAGVTAPAAATGVIGMAIVLPDPAPVDGYTFKGWTLSGDADGFFGAQNVSAVGTWVRDSHTATFYAADGAVLKQSTYYYGDVVTAPAIPEKEGFTFIGWLDAWEDPFVDGTVMEDDDLDYTAAYQANPYTVTFTVDGAVYETRTVLCGEAIPQPAAPEKEGCTFTGWSPAVPETMPAQNLNFAARFRKNTYQLTFDVDGETQVTSVQYGDAISAPADPEKEGYTFAGWSPAVPQTMPAADQTFTAQWAINRYVVTFIADGATIKSESVEFGAAVTLPQTPEKAGFRFTGWRDDAGAAVTGDFAMPARAYTLTAQFAENRYVLTLDAAGGLLDGAAVQTAGYAFGAAVAQPSEPVRAGYTFLGWDGDVPATMPAGDVTLTAQWAANLYTVYYTYNGAIPAGVLDPEPAEGLKIGDAIPLPAHPAAPGYTVTDWALTDAYGVPITATEIEESDVLATAVWRYIDYTITYVYEGAVPAGAAAPETVTGAHIGDAIAQPTPPEAAGYRFLGWTLSGDENGKVGAADVTVTGVWAATERSVTYVFAGDVPAGAELPAAVTDAQLGDAIALPAVAAVEGFTFEGWTVSGDENGVVGARSVTVTGTWSRNSYTVVFEVDGAVVKELAVPYGERIQAPTAPAQPGLRFVGWQDENGVMLTAQTVMGAADQTYTAVYAEQSFTVTFYDENGEPVTRQQAASGALVDAPAYYPDDGRVVIGWQTANGANAAFPYTVSADVAFYPQLANEQAGLYYVEQADGTVTVVGCADSVTDLQIPAAINGKLVTAIAADAFRDHTGMQSASLPGSITQIGENAFDGCAGLKTVTYAGTEAAFDQIAIAAGNDPLLLAARTCHTHTYTSAVTREATCTQAGERTYTCVDGDDTYTEAIPMIDHTHGQWRYNAASGLEEEICPVCGQVIATRAHAAPAIQIVNNPGTREMKYREKLQFTVEAQEMPAGAHIEVYAGTALLRAEAAGVARVTVTTGELTGDTVLRAVLVDADGTALAEATETLKVNSGFFRRVIAFLKNLFGLLQTVKQAVELR